MKFLTALALAGACLAQEDKLPRKNPWAENVRAIESGRVQFRMSCAGCHGLRATGGRSGPDLTRSPIAASGDAQLYRVISDGIQGTEMPAFGGRLEDDERQHLASYVHSLVPRETAPIP